MRKNSFLIFLSLLILSFIFTGCQSSTTGYSGESNRIVATQDESNSYKYQFKVVYNGSELTLSDGSFSWNFGDGYGTSTEAMPEYEYVEEAERNVTVTVNLNKDSDGVYRTVSFSTTVIAGSPSEISSSVIKAYPGSGRDLLNYRLVSSATSDNETLHYKWVITGVTENVTYTYGLDEDLTSNIFYPNEQDHSNDHPGDIFSIYNGIYYIDLYIRTDSMPDFPDTATASMMLQTAIPDFDIDCSVNTFDNKTTCTPQFNYSTADNMTYSWQFYHVEGDEVTRDTTDILMSYGYIDGGAYEYDFVTAGSKRIVVVASSPYINGELTLTKNISLAAGGYLGSVSCYRPTDLFDAYTDNTTLLYTCEVPGYYISQNDNVSAVSLTSYFWKIAGYSSDGQAGYTNFYGPEVVGTDGLGGGSYSGNGFVWSKTGDNSYGNGYDDNVTTSVTCDGTECIASITFYAPQYNNTFEVSVQGYIGSENDARISNISLSNSDPDTIEVLIPTLSGVTLTHQDNKTIAAWSLTPVFTNADGDNVDLSRLASYSVVDYYWEFQKSSGDSSDSYESGSDGESYNGSISGVKSTAGTLDHVFSDNSTYYIGLLVEESDTGKSGSFPVLNGGQIKASAVETLEINLDFAGSYFQVTSNLSSQLLFQTNYVAHEEGSIVDTVYVYEIVGPNYANPGAETTTTLAVYGNYGNWETDKPVNEDGLGSGHYQALFNGDYDITLTVYNAYYFDNSSCTQQRNDPTAYGCGSSITTINNPAEGVAKKVLTATASTPKVVSGIDSDGASKLYFAQFYAVMKDNTSGEIGSMIDRNLFTCEWSVKEDDNCTFTFGEWHYMETSEYDEDNTSSTCDVVQMMQVENKGDRICGSDNISNLGIGVTISGPWYDNVTRGLKTKTMNSTMGVKASQIDNLSF